MSERIRIAIDLAKSVFQLAISERPGKVTKKARLTRAQLLPFLAQQPPATVFMEACGSAHYWARKIEQLGHKVVLLPPHYVRPYVRGNKTDRTDTQGILDAGSNEDLKPVPIKTVSGGQKARDSDGCRSSGGSQEAFLLGDEGSQLSREVQDVV